MFTCGDQFFVLRLRYLISAVLDNEDVEFWSLSKEKKKQQQILGIYAIKQNMKHLNIYCL